MYKNTEMQRKEKCYLTVQTCCFWFNSEKYLKILVLKLKIVLSSLNSFGRSYQSFAAANLNDDYPIAEDIVSPKSNKVASL